MKTIFILIPHAIACANIHLNDVMEMLNNQFGKLNIELSEDIAGGIISYDVSKEQADDIQNILDDMGSNLEILFIKGKRPLEISNNIIQIQKSMNLKW